MLEHFFLCPYCGAEISVLLDPSIIKQEYIEDCEVCCNPMKISFALEAGTVQTFDADTIEQ